MANKPLCGVDTINNVTANDKIFVNVNGTIKQSKMSDIPAMKDLYGLGYGERCAYNILKPTLQTTTINGLTCTQNLGADGKPDGTYTINGTSSKKTTFYIVDSNGIELNINNAKFIGCPSGGSISTYSLTLYDAKNNKWYDDYGDGKNIPDTSKITMYIQIYSGVTVSNIIFKPMITLDTTATYDDYKPYIPSVKMLADEVSAQSNSLTTQRIDIKNSVNTNHLIAICNGVSVTISSWGTTQQELGTSNEYAILGILPEGYRPIEGLICYSYYNENYKGQVRIYPTGEVKIGYTFFNSDRSNIPSGIPLYFCITFTL